MDYRLVDALENTDVFYAPETKCLQLPSGLICPGGWVVFAVHGCNNFRFWHEVLYNNDKQKNYALTIRFEEIMGGNTSDYRNRPNQGSRYSFLVKLESKNDADDASNAINGCVSYCLDKLNEKGSRDIKGVVAELHDNVWSHGKGTGISMAQLYDHEYDKRFEFALADCGVGFLEELRHANVSDVAGLDHIDAIKKCIEKDFSTKHSNDRDEWAQRLPDGHIGRSPYSEGIDTFDEDNNHQGLGLWKLVELVKLYNGTLFLASGDAIFVIKNGIEQSPLIGKINWKGVAVSCSFPLPLLSMHVDPPHVSKDVEDLIGGWDIVGD